MTEKTIEEQLKSITNLTNSNTKFTYIEEDSSDSDIKYKILTDDSQEKVLKKLKRFQKSHKILSISFSTNTKYSKMFDREYTEYHFFIQYL